MMRGRRMSKPDPLRLELIRILQKSQEIPRVEKAMAILAVSRMPSAQVAEVHAVVSEVMPLLEAGEWDAVEAVLRSKGIPEDFIVKGRTLLHAALADSDSV